MKRFLHILCLLAVAALLPAALLVSRGLPADARTYVEKKYAGWNGVLRAWVCTRWECSGGIVRWLNACAADFEKQHDGVYIEFTPVDIRAVRDLGGGGLRSPELVLFSPGTLDGASQLARLAIPDRLRGELRALGGGYAYPIAMGGYIWAYNRALTDRAPAAGGAIATLPDDGIRSFSAAAVALSGDAPDAASSGDDPPGADLDLGLPAVAGAEAAIASEEALDRFIAGDLPAVIVSQAELAKLIRLRDAGRGPDWACAGAGRVAYTDQLLFLGIPRQSGDDARERAALAEAFGQSLLAPDAQARLSDVGAFSVTGERIYSNLSAYAALDGLLNGRELLVPADPWAPAPDCGDLLRSLAFEGVDPARLTALLRERLQSPLATG